MKMTQFALAAIIVLLAVAGYLTIKSDLDSRLEAQNVINDKLLTRVEELAQKQQAAPPAAPVPAPAAVAVPAPAAPVPPVVPPAPVSPEASAALRAAAEISPNDPTLVPENDSRMLEDERKVLNAGATDRVAEDSLTLPSTLDGQPLTAIQKRIVAAPAIARVKSYAEKEGMIVLDSGTNANLRAGDPFSLRRKNAVIGKVRISDTIEASESIADIVPGSMPPGMLPAPGDELIQYGD